MKFIRGKGAIIFFIIISSIVHAQNQRIDVLHYTFHAGLNDSNNIIRGDADIRLIMNEPSKEIYFDLVSVNNGRGMKVLSVTNDEKQVAFKQEKNRVNIFFDSVLTKGAEENVNIKYEGVPADGLIIDTNKFHHRTFFADNWPNRARNWLPCNDHPADKASVEFIITAPDHYSVIANGVLTEETELPDHVKLTRWKEDVALPTKVMVIGVADFAIQLSGVVDCIPVTSWVFPENRFNGFKEYAISDKILSFFINYIGPYPYKKLANVQSRTRFGGMENASNIFYFENSVADDTSKHTMRRLEDLFAHETAHQWFGDAVSESDWPHLWLSEGFATYLTHLYIEHEYGTDSLKERMKHDRNDVIDFYKIHKTPVIDTSSANNLMQLLNENSYKKGSWVLHMLRRKLGDRVFQKGIQTYYETYKNKNASTDDFMQIMEKVSGQDLQIFFKQWLYTPGHPVLQVRWKYNASRKMLLVTVKQMQDYLFRFPLQFSISNKNTSLLKTVYINKKDTTLSILMNFIPQQINLDPGVNLLFAASVSEIK